MILTSKPSLQFSTYMCIYMFLRHVIYHGDILQKSVCRLRQEDFKASLRNTPL